jgi:hypothetical protein
MPRPTPCWLSLALFVGLLGLLASLAPSTLWPSSCPASIRSLRYTLWRRFFGSNSTSPELLLPVGEHPEFDPASGLPVWPAADLQLHGSCEPSFQARSGRTLLGVHGNVYDVTALGLQYYGPGATYCQFAGRDATRSLALGSLKEEDLARGGDVSGVDAEQVQQQHKFYLEKYGPPVGKLPSPSAAAAAKASAGAASEL